MFQALLKGKHADMRVWARIENKLMKGKIYIISYIRVEYSYRGVFRDYMSSIDNFSWCFLSSYCGWKSSTTLILFYFLHFLYHLGINFYSDNFFIIINYEGAFKIFIKWKSILLLYFETHRYTIYSYSYKKVFSRIVGYLLRSLIRVME